MNETTGIFTNGGGRLSNQLLNCAHLFAWAKEYNYGLINMAFWPYSEHYKHFAQNKLISINSIPNKFSVRFLKLRSRLDKLNSNNQRRLSKVYKRYLHLLAKLNNWIIIRTKDYTDINAPLTAIDLNDPDFNLWVKNANTVLLSGWNIRSWELVEKHAEFLRSLFIPTQNLTISCDLMLSELRSEFDIIIGLFIRQGDYRTWLGGKYFFDISQYNKWSKELVDHYPDKKVVILISCEEKLDQNQFDSDLSIRFSTGSANKGGDAVHTHYEFSQCDVIASAPSTFSAWAAFMGNKPLIPLSTAGIAFNEPIKTLSEAASHVDFKNAVN